MRASRAGSWLDDDQRSGRSRARSARWLALLFDLTSLTLPPHTSTNLFPEFAQKNVSLIGMHADKDCRGYRIISHDFVVIVGMLPANPQSLLLLPSLCVFWLGLMPCSVVSSSSSLSGGSAFIIAGAEDSGAIGPEMVVARRNALSGLGVMPSSDGSWR
jgi:hypothetical protein